MDFLLDDALADEPNIDSFQYDLRQSLHIICGSFPSHVTKLSTGLTSAHIPQQSSDTDSVLPPGEAMSCGTSSLPSRGITESESSCVRSMMVFASDGPPRARFARRHFTGTGGTYQSGLLRMRVFRRSGRTCGNGPPSANESLSSESDAGT